MSYDAALSTQDYTSAVHDLDGIPRMSIHNMYVMIRTTKQWYKNSGLAEKGKKMSRREKKDKVKELLAHPQNMYDYLSTFDIKHEQLEDSIFVPGKVIIMWKRCANTDQLVADARVHNGDMASLKGLTFQRQMFTYHGSAGYESTLDALIKTFEDGSSERTYEAVKDEDLDEYFEHLNQEKMNSKESKLFMKLLRSCARKEAFRASCVKL